MTWAQQVLADAVGVSLDTIRYYGGTVDFSTRKHFVDRWLAWEPWPLSQVDLTALSPQNHEVVLDVMGFRTRKGHSCPLLREEEVNFSIDYVPVDAMQAAVEALPPEVYILTAVASPRYLGWYGKSSGPMGLVHLLFLDASEDSSGLRAPAGDLPIHHASITKGSVVTEPMGQYLSRTRGSFEGFVFWRVDPTGPRPDTADPRLSPCAVGPAP